MDLILVIHEVIKTPVGYSLMSIFIIGILDDQTHHIDYDNNIIYSNNHKQKDLSGFKIGNKLQLTPHISVDFGYNNLVICRVIHIYLLCTH